MNKFNKMSGLKRLAIVSVTALGIGVLSALPSQAANSVLEFVAGDGVVGSDTSVGYGVAGPANSVTLRTTGAVASDYVVTTTSTFGTIDTGTVFDSARTIFTAGSASRFQVMTPTVGTVTVTYRTRTGGVVSNASAQTVTITVRAAQASGVFSAANSSVYIADGETSTATADATVLKTSTYDAANSAATIKVSLQDGNGAAYSDTVTATIVSGPGVINGTADSTTVGSTFAAAGSPTYSVSVKGSTTYFGVFANGQAGISTVVLRLTDGTVLATKTLTFSSTTAASISAVTKKNYVLAGSANSGAFAVVVKDAGGNVITGGTVTATPVAGSLVATAPTTGIYDSTSGAFLLGATGADSTKFGPITYTFTHSSTGTTLSAQATTTFSSGVASSLTITGPDSANPGDKVTFTLTAKDANGYPIADGIYEDVAGRQVIASTEYSASGLSPFNNGDTITTVNGVATSVAYMPFVAGKYTAKWTLVGTSGTASGALSAGLAGSTISAVVTVNQASDPKIVSAIDILTAQIASLQATLLTQQTSLQAQIDALTKAQSASNAKYNALAKKYNALAKKYKLPTVK